MAQALDLEEEEWEQFANGIAQLAAQRERKPKDFQAFQVRPTKERKEKKRKEKKRKEKKRKEKKEKSM